MVRAAFAMAVFGVLSINPSLSRAEALPSVVPLPNSMVTVSGSPFVIAQGTQIQITENDADSLWVSDYLKTLVATTTSLELKVSTKPDSGPSIRFIKTSGEANGESYSIDISGDRGAIVKAGSRAGLLYGAATLWQLMTSGRAHTIQALMIQDAPEMKWRGLLLDSARHYQSPEFIYKLIDLMALHKLNALHWHLTDDHAWRLEIKRFPKLTEVGAWRKLQDGESESHEKPGRYGGFYSQDEVRKIVRFAADRNVTIIPEIEMPGHASAAIVAYPELASTMNPPIEVPLEYGVLPNLINPLPKTHAFLHAVLDEVMELFPSRMIHLGGDEAIKDQWIASPEIQAYMHQLGLIDENSLQDRFMTEISDYIEAHGRTEIAWDYPNERETRPSMAKMVYLSADQIKTALRAGHDIVETMFPELYFDSKMSGRFPGEPGVHEVDPNPLEQTYRYDPIPSGLTATERSHLLGLQGALWTEDVMTEEKAELLIFPRELAAAELAWTKRSLRNWPDFVRRLVDEYPRFKSLGHGISDIPFRPLVQSKHGAKAASVRVSNQTSFGDFRYTLDGEEPTLHSAIFKSPTNLPSGTQLKIATFTPSGMKLSETVVKRLK